MKKDKFTLVYEKILDNLNAKKIVVESKDDYDKVAFLLETACFENGPLKVFCAEPSLAREVLTKLVDDKEALDEFFEDWDFDSSEVGEVRFGFVDGKFVGFTIATYDYGHGCDPFTADLTNLINDSKTNDKTVDSEGYPLFPGTEIRDDLAYMCDHLMDFAYDFAISAKKEGNEEKLADLREAAKTSNEAKEAIASLEL